MSTSTKLTYFNLNIGGARGFVARVCFRKVQGSNFNDERIDFSAWPALKPSTPLGQLPILELDGEVFTQSIPISKYAATLAGLYPTDPLLALRADAIVATVDDIWNKLGSTPKEEKARIAYAEEIAPKFLHFFAKNLGTDKFFCGQAEPTFADLWLYQYVKFAQSGFFDFVPKDFVLRHAPTIQAHHDAVAASQLYKDFGTPE